MNLLPFPSLALASSSPRRREILRNLGFETIVLPAAVDETPGTGEAAVDYVRRMARAKNRAAGACSFPVVAADTCVVRHGDIIGKPRNDEEAAAILRRLSGQTHHVLTAVCVSHKNLMFEDLSDSAVTFADLSEAEIRAYVACGEPADKAGAYGIQGVGGMFVSHIAGSFSGVMGLPVYETMRLLRSCAAGT